MESFAMEARILEILAAIVPQGITVYELDDQKGLPRSSAHRALKRLVEKGLLSFKWLENKKVYLFTPVGWGMGQKLHVPKVNNPSVPEHWRNLLPGYYAGAFSNVGTGDARAIIMNNGHRKQIFPLLGGTSILTSAINESMVFENVQGEPVIQYDPMCRQCGSKVVLGGNRRGCSDCLAPFSKSVA